MFLASFSICNLCRYVFSFLFASLACHDILDEAINKNFKIVHVERNNRSQKYLHAVQVFTYCGRGIFAVVKLHARGNRAYPWAEVDARPLYRTYVSVPSAAFVFALCTFISRCVTSKIDAQFVSASKDAVLQIGNFQIEPLLANQLKKWLADTRLASCCAIQRAVRVVYKDILPILDFIRYA